MTAPAYWKFESIPLQQRVHKLSVPVRAGRRQVPPSAHSEWDTAGLQQPPAEIPADSASTGHENPHLALRAKKLDIAFENLRAQIVWAKPHFTLGRGHYHWRHETCWYAGREGKPGHWQGGRKQTTVWEIANNNPFGNRQREQSWGHAAQKPVECMRRPIVNNSRPGELVYDPFLGSGTSLIAAEMTGRICCGLEISPAYVDVIVRRWQAAPGARGRPREGSEAGAARRRHGQICKLAPSVFPKTNREHGAERKLTIIAGSLTIFASGVFHEYRLMVRGIRQIVDKFAGCE